MQSNLQSNIHSIVIKLENKLAIRPAIKLANKLANKLAIKFAIRLVTRLGSEKDFQACFSLQTNADPDDVDSDTGPENEVKNVAEVIGQDDSSKLEEALGNLPPRWKNWVIRGVFTWLMIGGFGLIIYGGPLALMLTVTAFLKMVSFGKNC